MADILISTGIDFLTIDLEHSVVGIEQVLPLVQIAQGRGVVPLIRLTQLDPGVVKRVLDAGAMGVIVPMVNTPDEARAAVSAVKYPPQGNRGVGLSRAQGWGASFDTYFRTINDESLVVIQIEQREAVERIDEIFAVPGIDAYCIGPYDLSCSYGVPGQMDHPLMDQAEKRVMAAALKAGIAPGVHQVHTGTDLVARKIQAGYRFIACGVDFLFLAHGARATITQARAASERATPTVKT